MEKLKLIVDFEGFLRQLDEKFDTFGELENSYVQTEEEWTEIEPRHGELVLSVEDILKSSFNIERNEFVNEFQTCTANCSKIPTHRKVLTREKWGILQSIIREQRNSVYSIKQDVKISDCITSRNGYDGEVRKKFTTEDKQNLILEKLNELNDGYYYPVLGIMIGNGLIRKHYSEPLELIQDLKSYGYVDILGGIGDEISAKITVWGTKYVENMIQARIKLESERERVMGDVMDDRDMENLKSKLRRLIARNELEELMEELTLIMKSDTTIYNDVLLNSGRYAMAKGSERRGTISDSELHLDLNRIRAALSSIIGLMKREDLI